LGIVVGTVVVVGPTAGAVVLGAVVGGKFLFGSLGNVVATVFTIEVVVAITNVVVGAITEAAVFGVVVGVTGPLDGSIFTEAVVVVNAEFF
jgi:hypothetical protein